MQVRKKFFRLLATVLVMSLALSFPNGQISAAKKSSLKKNTITASSLTVVESLDKQVFSLKASAKGKAKLSYKSSDKQVKISSKGKVTVPARYAGTVTINIVAAKTKKYKKTTKKIKLKVINTVGIVPVAHRGQQTDTIPQNTCSAFTQASKEGYSSVEFDVRKTKDGIYVLSHDPYITVDDQDYYVADYTYQELKVICGDQREFTTLDEGLSTCYQLNLGIVLHVKKGSSDIASHVAAAGMSGRVWYNCTSTIYGTILDKDPQAKFMVEAQLSGDYSQVESLIGKERMILTVQASQIKKYKEEIDYAKENGIILYVWDVTNSNLAEAIKTGCNYIEPNSDFTKGYSRYIL